MQRPHRDLHGAHRLQRSFKSQTSARCGPCTQQHSSTQRPLNKQTRTPFATDKNTRKVSPTPPCSVRASARAKQTTHTKSETRDASSARKQIRTTAAAWGEIEWRKTRGEEQKKQQQPQQEEESKQSCTHSTRHCKSQIKHSHSRTWPIFKYTTPTQSRMQSPHTNSRTITHIILHIQYARVCVCVGVCLTVSLSLCVCVHNI